MSNAKLNRRELKRKIEDLRQIQIEYEAKGDLLNAQICWDEIVRFERMLED